MRVVRGDTGNRSFWSGEFAVIPSRWHRHSALLVVGAFAFPTTTHLRPSNGPRPLTEDECEYLEHVPVQVQASAASPAAHRSEP
jgi:hypothetical protein